MSAAKEVHRALPLGVGAVSEARRFVQASLRAWSIDSDTVASATLIVSELVTNAVLYGHGAGGLMVRLDGLELELEVGDRTTAEPARRTRSDDAEIGRGLHIIDAVAVAWGVRPTSDGKVVWARLACPAPAAPSDSTIGMRDIGVPDIGVPDIGVPDIGVPDIGAPDIGALSDGAQNPKA